MLAFIVGLFIRPATARPVIFASSPARSAHRPRPVARLLNRLSAFDAFDAAGV